MKEQMNNTSRVLKALLFLNVFLLLFFTEQTVAESSTKIEATTPEMKVLSFQKQSKIETIAQKIFRAHQSSDPEQRGYSHEKAISLWKEVENEIDSIDDDKLTMRGLLSLRIDGRSLLLYLLPHPQCEPKINSMRDNIVREALDSTISGVFSTIFSSETREEDGEYLTKLLQSSADGKRINLWYILASIAPSTCNFLAYKLHRAPGITRTFFIQEEHNTKGISNVFDTIKDYFGRKELTVSELFYALVTKSVYDSKFREHFPKYNEEKTQETLALLDEKFTSVFEGQNDKQLLAMNIMNQKDWKNIISKGSVNSHFFNAVIKVATQELSPEVRSLSPEMRSTIQKIVYETVQAAIISDTQNKEYSYEKALVMLENIQKEINEIKNNPQAIRALLSIRTFKKHYSFLYFLFPQNFYEPKINSIKDNIFATLFSSAISLKDINNEEFLSKLLNSQYSDEYKISHLSGVLVTLAPETVDCLGKIFCEYPNLIKTCLGETDFREDQIPATMAFYGISLSFTGVKHDPKIINDIPKYQVNNLRETITKFDNNLALAFSKLEDKKEVAQKLVKLWQLPPDLLANPHFAYFKAVLEAAEMKTGK